MHILRAPEIFGARLISDPREVREKLYYCPSALTDMKFLAWYLLLINLLAFGMYGIDKRRARRKRRRISESTLMMTAILGGSPGAWLGMKYFHHKTLHKKFSIGIPAIFLVQAALAVILYLRYT